MARRSGLPWAATSVPEIRDQWCTVLGEAIATVPARIAAARAAGHHGAADQWQRHLPDARRDLADLTNAELWWVARPMVDLAVGAAESLPDWSPSAAMPADRGLLCWAKPAGAFGWPVPGTGQVLRMPVDAMTWAVRDGSVGVTVAFRWDRLGDQLAALLPRQPLVQHPIGVWDLDTPVAPRVEDGHLAPLAVLGSAWLLMSSTRIVATRTITARTSSAGTAQRPDAPASAVSLIELRRLSQADRASSESGASGRDYSKKWWVAGHWRQQACGPKRSLRKPIWISPYIKGPDGAPLSTRVTVWQR